MCEGEGNTKILIFLRQIRRQKQTHQTQLLRVQTTHCYV